MRMHVLTFSVAVLLAGCTGTGPRVDQILGNKDAVTVRTTNDQPYAVLQVDSDLANVVNSYNHIAERTHFISNGPAAPISIGVGDRVQVTIVSTNDNGFLDIANSALAPISAATLPTQQVGQDGMISVPPIGRVRASGQSVQGFERFLTRKLGEVLVEPTAIVSMLDRESAQVTLVGNIAAPGTYSINQNSKHLTDVIALSGGATLPAEDVRVVMSRGKETRSARLVDIYEKPEMQVHLRKGDIIRFEPLTYDFTVLGPGGANSNYTVTNSNRTLAKALGVAGGLRAGRGDARGVFVYRQLPKPDAAAMGVDVSDFYGDSIPTIFQFNMRDPRALFTAQKFDIADDDIIYVSSTAIAEVNDFFSAFNIFVATPREIVN
ncbi:polysaccharide biosynthesis/export family protein [Sulfitobacter sp. JB4-11]|uniref:polysaccharide biosynthesis/export family protein n=1 Tax=Sulfitobacter rhodophyticola TaxID=3238304 RepID=UPI003517104E